MRCRHNNCKIDTGWNYTRNPDGTYTWTTHTGHSYTSHPPGRPTPKAAPSPAPEPATDLHEAEDTAYRDLIGRTTTELHIARALGDHQRERYTYTMLIAHRKQRARQLAHRRDPFQPPF